MAKKRKIKKKTVLVLLLFLICFCLYKLINYGNDLFGGVKIKSKLTSLGYGDNEVKILINNVPSDSYNLLKDYDESLIDLVSSKDYNIKLFPKYYEYYSKNKKSNIQDIIAIINSRYDLINYPASHLLASLVSEKYYIHKNVARYLDYGKSKKIKAREIISIVNSNSDMEYYNDIKTSSLDDDNLILVNKFYHLPDKYEPKDLVTLSSEYNMGTNSKMRKEAAEAFMKMAGAALLDNIILKNASAYRSYDYQVNLYNSYVNLDGEKNADIYSARPGFSEHQTGLCTDINTIDSSFDDTKEANWLAKNAYKYGFILRFPKGKEKITGYKYESWHYRYVGKEVAKIIYKNDLTFEEYYAYYVAK